MIYDGGAPNGSPFVVAEGSYSIIQAAQAFTLAAGANTIGGVNWWGICGQGACPTGDFAISFYNDFGGAPSTIIGLSQRAGNANQTATGNEIDDTHPEYAYSASLAPVTLTPGTRYWLGISNFTGLGPLGWAWEATSRTGAHAQFDSDRGWFLRSGDLAFNLTGPPVGTVAVPEPASLALLGSSLLGLAALRRRKKAG